MKLTISEGLAVAEKQAWAKTGERHRWWFTYGKRMMPVLVLAGAFGAVVWGAYALVMWAGDAIQEASVPSGVPGAWWFVAGLLFLATVIGLRAAGRAMRFGPAAAIYIGLLMAWSGVVAYALGAIA